MAVPESFAARPPITLGDTPPDFLTADADLEELPESAIVQVRRQPSEGSRVDRLEVERASCPAGW